MNNQEILDNAPEGATHVDNVGDYFKVETVYQYEDESDCGYEARFRLNGLGDWIVYRDDLLLTRSLADIKRIAELEKGRDEHLANIEIDKQAVPEINLWIAIREIEQQIKGVEHSIKLLDRWGSARVILDNFRSQLQKELKALRRQGE